MNINVLYLAEQIIANIDNLKIFREAIEAKQIKISSFAEKSFLKHIDLPNSIFSILDYEDDSTLINRICAMADEAESTGKMLPYIVLWSLKNDIKQCIPIEEINTIGNFLEEEKDLNFSFVLGDRPFPEKAKQMTDRALCRIDIVSLFS